MTMTPELESQMQQLLDIRACEDAIRRYCRILDRLDTERQASC